MGRPKAEAKTRPCEHCGQPVTRTKTQQSQRQYWTCGRSCANQRRIALGNTPTWGDNPYRGQRETRPCGVCGAPVTRYLTPDRVEKQWYCSYTCSGKAKIERRHASGIWTVGHKPRKGDMVPCVVCGTSFYREPALVRQGRKLCSTACNAAYQRKDTAVKACERCGAEMTLKPSQMGRRFCSKVCDAEAKTKRTDGRLHNGRPVIRDSAGYLWLYEPGHPNANVQGRVREHRWVMEKVLGRPLRSDEQVDHINQDRADNRPENLQVLDATTHTQKTNADRLRREQRVRDQLAEVERRHADSEARHAAEVAALQAKLAALGENSD